LGYKLLLGLYWDGKSTIPLDFSFLREKGKRSAKPYGMSRKELHFIIFCLSNLKSKYETLVNLNLLLICFFGCTIFLT